MTKKELVDLIADKRDFERPDGAYGRRRFYENHSK